MSLFYENRITGLQVKLVDPCRNSKDESNFQNYSDAEKRKHREQIGLETLVVYAVNDAY